jgi:hypothetical protein
MKNSMDQRTEKIQHREIDMRAKRRWYYETTKDKTGRRKREARIEDYMIQERRGMSGKNGFRTIRTERNPKEREYTREGRK